MSTKKIRILIFVLIGLLIAGTCGYIAVDTLKSREEQAAIEEANSLTLFDFDENSIDKVDLQFPEGNFTVENTADGWTITETDYSYPITLNAFYINTICNYMSTLTAMKKLDITPEELSAYGLDSPQKLTCSQGSTEYTLYIGNASATQEYYYVMLPDNSIVYAIDFDKGEIMKGGLSYLKDPYMISWMDVNINYVRLEQKDKISFEIEKDEQNRWQMAAPLKDAPLNSANINSMLTSLTRLQIDTFVKMVENPEDLTEYHLNDPAYQLALKTENGEAMTIDFAKFSKEDTSVYLVYEETGQIAQMSVNSVSFLQTQASELMTDKIYSPDISEVSELEVQADDLHFILKTDLANNKAFFCPDDAEQTEINGNTDEVQKAFNELFQSVSNLTYDSLELDAEIDETIQPTVIFHYTLTDGSEMELSLVPIDDTFYQAFLNGEYTGKIVRRRALSGNAGVLTYYEKLTDAIALSSES